MTEAPTAPAFGLSRPTLTFYTPIIVAFAGQTLAELRESPAGLTLLDRSRWYDEYPAELLAPAGRYEVLLAVDESVGLDEDLQQLGGLVAVTQQDFWDMTRHLVAKTLAPARKALRDAGLSPAEVKGVVMVVDIVGL